MFPLKCGNSVYAYSQLLCEKESFITVILLLLKVTTALNEISIIIFTYLEANIFQAFRTTLSSGFSRNWLLLTKEADFSYLLNALGVFHALKAS